MNKVPFDSMCVYLDKLDEEYVVANGLVDYSLTQRTRECLAACGWTEQEFADEIDRRWCEIYDRSSVVKSVEARAHVKLVN